MTAFPKSILTILTLTTLTTKVHKRVLFVYFFLAVCKPPD